MRYHHDFPSIATQFIYTILSSQYKDTNCIICTLSMAGFILTSYFRKLMTIKYETFIQLIQRYLHTIDHKYQPYIEYNFFLKTVSLCNYILRSNKDSVLVALVCWVSQKKVTKDQAANCSSLLRLIKLEAALGPFFALFYLLLDFTKKARSFTGFYDFLWNFKL